MITENFGEYWTYVPINNNLPHVLHARVGRDHVVKRRFVLRHWAWRNNETKRKGEGERRERERERRKKKKVVSSVPTNHKRVDTCSRVLPFQNQVKAGQMGVSRAGFVSR